MPRLPQVGGDEGNWGDILNEYLSTSHDTNGMLKASTVDDAQLKPGAVSNTKLQDNVITTSKLADNSVTSAKLQGAGQANGIATLDSNSQLPESQIPTRLSDEELSAKIDTFAVPLDSKRRIMREAGRVYLDGDPTKIIKGVNISMIGADDTQVNMMTSSWVSGNVAQNVIDQIEKARHLGCNVVRFLGFHTAYALDPVGYKEHFSFIIDAIKDAGMRALPSILNHAGGGYPVTLADLTTYKAMATDIISPYIGDSSIYAWDICNELFYSDADHRAIIAGMSTHIRSLDPNVLLTCSTPWSALNTWSNDPSLVASSVDFYDIHYYPNTTGGGNAPYDPMAQLSASFPKPILLGEVGASVGTAPSSPVVGSLALQDAYLRAVGTWTASRFCLGALVWNLQDGTRGGTGNSGYLYGLYDNLGNPRPQVAAFMNWRTDRVRPSMASDYNRVVTLHDNFIRNASSSLVGGPERGSAPVAMAGTWGIRASYAGAYAATKDGTKPDLLTWDLASQFFDVEADIRVSSTPGLSAGLTFDVTDADNWYAAAIAINSGTGEIEAKALKRSGGITTVLATSVLTGLKNGTFPLRIRLGVRYEGGICLLKAWDSTFAVIDKGANPAGGIVRTSKVGVFIGSGDTNSSLASIRASTFGRTV